MIEIIAVLILFGIVAAAVVSRGITSDEVRLQTDVDTLKGHLRFAQYRAMNDLPGTRWGIRLGGASYTLVRVDNSGTTTPVPLPGESSVTRSFESGTVASVVGNNPVLFDEWGNPGATPSTVRLGAKTILVTAGTGFIP